MTAACGEVGEERAAVRGTAVAIAAFWGRSALVVVDEVTSRERRAEWRGRTAVAAPDGASVRRAAISAFRIRNEEGVGRRDVESRGIDGVLDVGEHGLHVGEEGAPPVPEAEGSTGRCVERCAELEAHGDDVYSEREVVLDR